MATAVSYGRMAARHPSAGSAYAYVGRGLNSSLGFLAGWAMFLDYLMIPIINTMYGALTLHRLLPELPYWVWAAVFAGAVTLLNCLGIRSTARANQILLAAMFAVVAAFILLAIRYLMQTQGWGGLISAEPFYRHGEFEFEAVATATSFAALTYIGFDSVTTLAEEVKNPKRDVLVATVSVCLLTGVLSTLLVYLAQRIWPDYGTFPNLETAFMDVSRKAGGAILFHGMAAVITVSQFGSALTGQAGAARLLFGMGRDNVLPKKFFAYVNERRSVPTLNVVTLGVVCFAGAMAFSYQQAAELLNFGAFLAFLGVNAAAWKQFYRDAPAVERSWLRDGVPPVIGFLFCLVIFLSLPHQAKLVGGLWLAAGMIYLAVKRGGFRRRPPGVDFFG